MDPPGTVYFLCVYLYKAWVLGAVWRLHHSSVLAPPVGMHPVPQGRPRPSGPLGDTRYWKDTGHLKWGSHVPSQGPLRALPSDPLEGPAALHLGPLPGIETFLLFPLVGKVRLFQASGMFSKSSNQEIPQ